MGGRIPTPRFELVRVRDESLIDDMRAALNGDRERARKRQRPAPEPPPTPPPLDAERAQTPKPKTLRERFGRRRRPA